MQKVDRRRLTLKSEKSTCYPILKIQSQQKDLKGKRFGDIKKAGLIGIADRWVLVQVKKNISTV